MTRTALLVVVLGLGAGCAHPYHTATVADSAIYEVISDIHATEQVALCGKPTCAGVPPQPIDGWSVAKSEAFNKKLLPAAEAGRQLTIALLNWKPGRMLPVEIAQLIESVSEALTNVAYDFPDGSTKAKVLADLARVQQIVLSIMAVLVNGGP
jgi:hypothetical protein